MSQQYPDKVTFQDVASCFSDEEWKLLHEWQKELYTNVMKEIQQSLMSLGPLIAASVFSLRAKENERLPYVDHPEPKTRHNSNHSPRFQSRYPDLDLENGDESDVSFTGDPYAESAQSSTEHSSGYAAVPEVFVVRVKEEETYSIDFDGSQMTENVCSPTGSASMSKQRKTMHSIKYTEKTPSCQSTIGKAKAKMMKGAFKGTEFRAPAWSVSNRKLRGGKTNQYERGFSSAPHFSLRQASPKPGMSEKYDKSENKLRNPSFLKGLPNTQHSTRMFSCTQCNKSYSLKGELIRHMITHSGMRPYQCTECEKSFFQMPHLIRHQTTHSGEKPFICNFCHKRFNRKDYLNAHKRIHTGERPYKCTECERTFTWKGELNQHLKKHTTSSQGHR